MVLLLFFYSRLLDKRQYYKKRKLTTPECSEIAYTDRRLTNSIIFFKLYILFIYIIIH